MSKTQMGAILDKIIASSEDDHYNPFKHFNWPDQLEEDTFWMSPELMSIHGTELEASLTVEQKIRLSKWESINFYSMNVHGIRELLLEVIQRVHMPGFEEPSRYFHHFIGEENEHMYFFAKFCINYGDGKLYQSKKIKINKDVPAEVEHFLVFSRILLFEEVVDFFNMRMAADENLHPIIREINKIHHQDESRHIAFGRQLVKYIWDNITNKYLEEVIADTRKYIVDYLIASMNDFYNPVVYKDAGLEKGLAIREELIKNPARIKFHKEATNKVVNFLIQNKILEKGVFEIES